MKKLYLITFVLIANVAISQTLEVTDFRQIPNDISASRYPRLDANDNNCALIKILTSIKGMGFESNLGIVGNIENKSGEYWVYVSAGERRLSFWGEGYLKFNYNLPEATQSGKVYQLVIVPTGASDGIVRCAFRFRLSPINWGNLSGFRVVASPLPRRAASGL